MLFKGRFEPVFMEQLLVESELFTKLLLVSSII